MSSFTEVDVRKMPSHVLDELSQKIKDEQIQRLRNVPLCSKQKTLDSWIIKNNSVSPAYGKGETNSKDKSPSVGISNFVSEKVSNAKQNCHLPSNSSSGCKEFSYLQKVPDFNRKLSVFLKRDEFIESQFKSPERPEISCEKVLSSPKSIGSPCTAQKHVLVSEQPKQGKLVPEKQSPKPIRSYNLRSSRSSTKCESSEKLQNNKNMQSFPDKKSTKLLGINANVPEMSVEEAATLTRAIVCTSSQKQASIDEAVLPAPKEKPKINVRSKDKNIHDKTQLDSSASKIKKKNLSKETATSAPENLDFPCNVSDNKLEPVQNSKSHVLKIDEVCIKKSEKSFEIETDPANADRKKIYRKRNDENNQILAQNISISGSKQTSKNDAKESATSSKTSTCDTTKTLSTVAKKNFIHTSPINKKNVSLNQNGNYLSVCVNDDLSGKDINSLISSSQNELNAKIEKTKEHEDQSHKCLTSSKVIKSDKPLHPQASLKLSVPKKIEFSKKRTSSQPRTNTRKKVKVEKNINTSQSISENLCAVSENSALTLKKSTPQKELKALKSNVATNSIKEQSDVLTSKSTIGISDSFMFEEPKDPPKNLKQNGLEQSKERETNVKNSKKGKKSNSIEKSDFLKSPIDFKINLSKGNEIERTHKNSVKNKFRKTFVEKANLPKTRKTSKKKCNRGTEQEGGCSSEKSTEVQIELYSAAADTPETSDSVCLKDVGFEKVEEMMDSNQLVKEKEKHDTNVKKSVEKEADIAINKSNDSDASEINLPKRLVALMDEEMRQNYRAYCKVKEELKFIDIDVDELFEHPQMIDTLKSVPQDGVYLFARTEDSGILVLKHDSTKELTKTLIELKKKHINS